MKKDGNQPHNYVTPEKEQKNRNIKILPFFPAKCLD